MQQALLKQLHEPQGTTDQRFEPDLFRGVGAGTEVSYDGIASSDVSSTVFTEQANIESVYHIQKIIAMRKDIDMNTDFTATPFYYDFADSFTMTSGKKMVRKYTISRATYNDIEPYLKSLYESKEFKNYYKLTNLKGTITSIDYAYSGSGLHVEDIVILCGHYEGIDQRILDGWDIEEISIGDYILTGGEPAAIVLVDTVARMLPGVLGDSDGVMTGYVIDFIDFRFWPVFNFADICVTVGCVLLCIYVVFLDKN